MQRRRGQEVYANLLNEIEQDDPETFRQYHGLDIPSFKNVLKMVEPSIQKTDTVMRPSDQEKDFPLL